VKMQLQLHKEQTLAC